MDEIPAWYRIGSTIVGIGAFVALWIYAVATYGWFLGGGLGWIPAMFIAGILAVVWPVLVSIAAALFLGAVAIDVLA